MDHCTLSIVMSTCIWLLRQQKLDIHSSLLAPHIRHPLLSIHTLKENVGSLDVKGQIKSRLTDHVLNVQEHFWSSHQLAEFNGAKRSPTNSRAFAKCYGSVMAISGSSIVEHLWFKHRGMNVKQNSRTAMGTCLTLPHSCEVWCSWSDKSLEWWTLLTKLFRNSRSCKFWEIKDIGSHKGMKLMTE